jgi:hypothetical protein
MCHELLQRLQIEETFGFAQIVTGDELWLYLNYSHNHMWSVSDDKCPVRLDEMIASEKHMLTLLWSINSPLVIEWLEPVDKFNTTYFCDVIIAKLVQALCLGEAVLRQRKFSSHLDNVRPRNSAGATEFIHEKIHPIVPSAIFAGCSIIRLLSLWNA